MVCSGWATRRRRSESGLDRSEVRSDGAGGGGGGDAADADCENDLDLGLDLGSGGGAEDSECDRVASMGSRLEEIAGFGGGGTWKLRVNARRSPWAAVPP